MKQAWGLNLADFSSCKTWRSDSDSALLISLSNLSSGSKTESFIESFLRNVKLSWHVKIAFQCNTILQTYMSLYLTASQIQCFLNPELIHISIVRSAEERVEKQKHLEVYWVNLLFITLKKDQSEFLLTVEPDSNSCGEVLLTLKCHPVLIKRPRYSP